MKLRRRRPLLAAPPLSSRRRAGCPEGYTLSTICVVVYPRAVQNPKNVVKQKSLCNDTRLWHSRIRIIGYHCTNSFALQNLAYLENGVGARALELVAPSLVPRPGRLSVVPQPSSGSPGWCFLRGVRPWCPDPRPSIPSGHAGRRLALTSRPCQRP